MKILAIETSATCSQVAVVANGQKVSFSEADFSHSKVILSMVNSALEEADTSLAELDMIAVTQGPGSFTGLRIGIAVAQGLAFSNNLPVIPLSSMQVLAFDAFKHDIDDKIPTAVFASADARMQQLYGGWYIYQDETPVLVGNECVIEPKNILSMGVPVYDAQMGIWQLSSAADYFQTAQSRSSINYYFTGSGATYKNEYPQNWLSLFQPIDTKLSVASATGLAELAQQLAQSEYKVGHSQIEQKWTKPTELLPVYLRNNVTY